MSDLEGYLLLECRWAGPACQEWHLGQCTLEGAAAVAAAAAWVELEGAVAAEAVVAGCSHII